MSLLSPFVRKRCLEYHLSFAILGEGQPVTYVVPSENTRITRCTIGRGLPSNQTTGMSPASTVGVQFQRNRMSPRWKAGAMDSDMTQITGAGEFVRTQRPFHAMKVALSGMRMPRMAEAKLVTLPLVHFMARESSGPRQFVLFPCCVVGGR